MIDFAKLAIAIVTHRRPKEVQHTLRTALASVPGYRVLYVLGNHPDDQAGIGKLVVETKDARVQFLPTGRIPEHGGRLAESWNTAFQWAFRDPEVEWLWCMHDDLDITPGWSDLVHGRDADVYVAPFGDTCFLLNRRAFREVGWFDERFTVRAYQDTDWELRAVWKLGRDRVVLENEIRPPKALKWVSLNPIGLLNHWRLAQTFDDSPAKIDKDKPGLFWLKEKWDNARGVTPIDFDKAVAEGPAIPDIDFYPWFDRGAA
jgi:hypothetical protein